MTEEMELKSALRHVKRNKETLRGMALFVSLVLMFPAAIAHVHDKLPRRLLLGSVFAASATAYALTERHLKRKEVVLSRRLKRLQERQRT